MRTLVYKRTHPFDPAENGVFGNQDCMGRVRDFDFDAVIGIGGVGARALYWEIDEKINWIGIGSHRHESGDPDWRGSLVTFDHFLLLEAEGPELWLEARNLALRMYIPPCPRLAIEFTRDEAAEIERILQMAEDAPPSPVGTLPARRKCRMRQHSVC